jgi:hypothetical protein
MQKVSKKDMMNSAAGAKRKKGANVLNGGAEFDKNDALENARIFVFVLGGMSHHEVVSISNM